MLKEAVNARASASAIASPRYQSDPEPVSAMSRRLRNLGVLPLPPPVQCHAPGVVRLGSPEEGAAVSLCGLSAAEGSWAGGASRSVGVQRPGRLGAEVGEQRENL